MSDFDSPYRADVSELRGCLELLQWAGLNVITVTDGDDPVAYLIPFDLIKKDMEEGGYS